MKRLLRILAAVTLLAAVAFWGATGAHRGWTRTSIPKKILDEVTGIEGVVYEKGFVPGVDFLALSGLVGGVLVLASFLGRNKKLEL